MPSEKDLRQADYFRNRLSRTREPSDVGRGARAIEALRLYDRDIPEVPSPSTATGTPSCSRFTRAPTRRTTSSRPSGSSSWPWTAAEALRTGPGTGYSRRRASAAGLGPIREDRHREGRTHRQGGRALLHRQPFRLPRYGTLSSTTGDEVPRPRRFRGQGGPESLRLYRQLLGLRGVRGRGLGDKRRPLEYLSVLGFSQLGPERILGPRLSAGQRADVAAFLEDAAAAGRGWDLIVADPPTFSNSKGALRDFDVNEDWADARPSLRRAAEPGREALLLLELAEAEIVAGTRLRDRSPASWEDLSAATIPPDFRDAKIHRCWRLSSP